MSRSRAKAFRRIDWPARFQALAKATSIPMLAAYYDAGVVSGDTPLSQTPFVALDLETTGLDPQQSAIVSIGLVPFTLRRIRVAEAKYWVVRPRRALAPESVLIHRITHEELLQAPRFSAVLPALLEALAGRVVVVHYRNIERPFLDQVCRRWMGDGLVFPLIDTMTVEAWSLHHNRSWLQRVGGWLGFKRRASVRLAACRERYHLPAYTAHHAMTDALATAELFMAQAAWHLDAASPVRRWWL